MPILENARYERFAQALAVGKTAVDAYEAAGYRRNRGHASTLRRNPRILQRVDEILETKGQIQGRGALAAIERAMLSKTAVIEMLLADRELARVKGQSSAAIRAAELLGKELGMFIDRAEVRSTLEARIAGMTRERRLARLAELLEPMQKYLSELEHDTATPAIEAEASETEDA